MLQVAVAADPTVVLFYLEVHCILVPFRIEIVQYSTLHCSTIILCREPYPDDKYHRDGIVKKSEVSRP